MTYMYWLGAAVLFVIVEVLPPATHFVCLGFALGALGAAIAAFLGAPLWLCGIVFGVVSAAFMPILVPLAKFLFRREPTEDAAAREMVGSEATVIEAITPDAPGTIRRGEDVWRCRSDDGPRAVGETVRVVRIDGLHAIVRRI